MGRRRRRALALLREAVALLSSRRRTRSRAAGRPAAGRPVHYYTNWTLLPDGILEHTEGGVWITAGSLVGVWVVDDVEESVEEACVTKVIDANTIEIEWDDGGVQTIGTNSVDHASFPLRPLSVPVSDGERALIRRVLNRPDLPWSDRAHEHAWIRAINDALRDLPAQIPGRVREALLLGRATKEPLDDTREDRCGICGSKRTLRWLVCGLGCGSECAARVGAINRFVATIREVDDDEAWHEARDGLLPLDS